MRTQPVGKDYRAAARVVVGGQVFTLDRLPQPHLVQHGGEVLVTPWDFPPIHFSGLPAEEPHGYAVVHLER